MFQQQGHCIKNILLRQIKCSLNHTKSYVTLLPQELTLHNRCLTRTRAHTRIANSSFRYLQLSSDIFKLDYIFGALNVLNSSHIF